VLITVDETPEGRVNVRSIRNDARFEEIVLAEKVGDEDFLLRGV